MLRSVRCAALALPLLLAAPGCVDVPPVTPEHAPQPPGPPSDPAPPGLTGISIYVHTAASHFENADDCYDHGHATGYTNELRRMTAVALAKAGYKVAIDRSTPADLTAIIHMDWSHGGSENAPAPDGVATLALRDHDGASVDRFSITLKGFGTGYSAEPLLGHGASALTSSLARSEPLARFAEEHARRRALTVAAGDPTDAPVKPAAPAMTFADAVKDAAEANPSEVWTGLVPLLPSTPKLRWSDQGQKKRVLMVTWTSYKGYDDKAGKSEPLGRETWVTPAPFVAEFCKGKASDPAALVLRLEQLLGLPPNNGKDRFVELWAEPRDIFRPCADPEITDRECEVDFPQPSSLVTVSAAHVKWFEDLKSKSYGDDGYPWTRLGYTYDWAGPKTGMSEYVIKKGAGVTIERVAATADYCR